VSTGSDRDETILREGSLADRWLAPVSSGDVAI
jgi:hypothetical protein